jgi:hypothetical protein
METPPGPGLSNLRIFGAEIVSGTDGLSQLWAFIVFPLLSGVLGVLIWFLVHNTAIEDTVLGHRTVVSARDRIHDGATRVEGRLR